MTSDEGASSVIQRRTRALISSTALSHNVREIRKRIGDGVRTMGVVKANAYGHGAEYCVQVLRKEGVDLFGVAYVEEGVALRMAGVTERIVVLASPVPGRFDDYVRHNLEPFVSDVRTATELGSSASAAGRQLSVHAFVDTGMTRNGCLPENVPELLDTIARNTDLQLQGLASHFATSDELDNDYTAKQIEKFDETLRTAISNGHVIPDVHIANSGGVFNFPSSHYTVVRPGLSLYGYHPTESLQVTSNLQPVMRVESVVTSIRRIAKGSAISYGRKFYAPIDTMIATVSIGYGDGLMRTLTNKASVLIGGVRYPIVGTICMDEVMIDLGAEPVDVKLGDTVTILGTSGSMTIDAWEIATLAGTIPYEITCAVSQRVPRVDA